MHYAYAETKVMFRVSDHYDHCFYCVILPWVTDFVQRPPKISGMLIIILTKLPFLSSVSPGQRGWNNPKFTEGIKVSLEGEAEYSEVVGPLFAKTREGLFSLGKEALNHESLFRSWVGDIGFLQKLVCHSSLSYVDWSTKPDPVLFSKSHGPFCPRHSRNTLSISLNNVAESPLKKKRQSCHWNWSYGYW